MEMNKFGYYTNAINPIKKGNKKNKNKLKVRKISEKDKRPKENSNKIKVSKNIKNKKFKYNKNNPKTISYNKSIDSNFAINSNKSLKLKENIIKNKNLNLSNKNKITIDCKILTNNIINIYKKSAKKNKKNNIKISPKSYYLIQIDANNKYNRTPVESHIILDNYDYESSIKHDKRSFWRIFFICTLAKENIINMIFFRTPLDIQVLRICLFIFIYSSDLAFNTIFYSNENISEIYHYQGDSLFLF